MDADRVHLIAVELAAEGSAECPPGTDVAAWHLDAQEAARRLDRSVLTHRELDGSAVAQLEDWPRDDTERAVHEAALRRAAVAAWTDPGGSAPVPLEAADLETADHPAPAGPTVDAPHLVPLPSVPTPDREITHPSQRSAQPDLRLVTDEGA